MFTQNALADRQKTLLPNSERQLQIQHPLLSSMILLLFLGIMLSVLGVVITARAEPIPQLLDLDLPQAYLPGSPMSKDVLCYFYPFMPNNASVHCSVNYLSNEVRLKFDADMKTIIQAIAFPQDHTIGELIASWGTPTGIIQTSSITYIYWGARSAHLYTTSFRPDSRVEYIQYDLEPQPASPWRGFQRYRN